MPNLRGSLSIAALVVLLGIVSTSTPALAQQPTRVYRVGHLHGLFPTVFHDTFWNSLRDARFAAGKNLVAERRYAEGKAELLPALAAELVRAKVDLIFATSAGATRAATAATDRIPIVAFDLEMDPVEAGLVASFARPGGNLTGVFLDIAELRGRQLALLADIVPGLARAAALWDPSTDRKPLRAAEAAARSMGIRLQTHEVGQAVDIERAFSAITSADAQAVLVLI